MKNIKIFVIFLVIIGVHNIGLAQNDDTDRQIQSDEDVIIKKFTETLVKLTLYNTQIRDEDQIIMICENYMVSAQGALLAIKNPTFKNIKDYVVKNLLPDYSEQGTLLETVIDKELMRDVDQYIKYARTFMDYGLNMTAADKEVRVYLSPEKGVVEQYEMEEGVNREEITYNGITAGEYQQRVTELYQEINEYEPTGVAEIDDQAILDMISSKFSDEQDQQNVLVLMESLLSTEWTGDEEVDQPILQDIFNEYFLALESDQMEEEEETEIVEEELDMPENEGWDNGLNELLANMGVGDRSVSARYGEAAEPFYSEYKQNTLRNQEEAQVALTNVFDAWETLQLVKYTEMAIEMEQIGRELIENGVDYNTSDIKEFYGQMRTLWELIKKEKG